MALFGQKDTMRDRVDACVQRELRGQRRPKSQKAANKQYQRAVRACTGGRKKFF